MDKRYDERIRPPNKEIFILGAIVVLALSIRLVCSFQLHENYPYFSNPPEGTDMLTYHRYAIAHLNGTFDKFPHYYNVLYPYFLALIYFAFGQNVLTAKIAQIFLGCINCVLIYFISKEIFNKNVGLIAATLTALYAPFIIFNSVLLVVTLLTFLITITLFLILLANKKESYLLTIGAGISMGLATLARGSNFFLVPPVMLWLFVVLKGKAKKRMMLPSIFFISCLGVISTITIQNYVLGDKFVFISTNPGINFAIGNSPGAQGWFHYPEWLKATPQREQTDYGNSAFWIKETLKSIQEKPSRWLKLMFKKLCLFWHHREIPNNVNQEYIRQYSFVLKYLPLFTFGIVVPLGLMGITISFEQWRKLSLLYIFLFVYMCTIMIIFVVGRYRLPFVQILIPFSAFTIYEVSVILLKKDFKYLGFIILLLIPSLIVTHFCNIYQMVKNEIYIKSHPNGTYIESKNLLIIRDDSGRWQDGIFVVLDKYRERVKKNLIINIDKDLSKIKKANLMLNLVCPKKEGEIILEVNNHPAGKIKCAQIYTGETSRSTEIPFSPSLLLPGENSFVFSVAQGGALIILIDNYYNYKRSAFSSNLGLEWNYTDLAPNKKGKDKGEYMISLQLEFEIS